MKKIVLIILSIFLIVACSNEDLQKIDENDDQKGTLEIRVNNGDSRAWNNSDIDKEGLSYEVIIYNDSRQLSSGVFTESSKVLSLNAGTYYVLVLAGNNNYHVKGLGEAKNLTIGDSENIVLNIEMNTYKWTTNWPTEDLLAGSTLTLSADIIFPVTNMVLDTSTYWEYIELNDKNYEIYYILSENTPAIEGTSEYSFSISNIDIPLTSGAYEANYYNSSYLLRVQTVNKSFRICDITGRYWKLGTISGDKEIIRNEFYKTLTVVDDPNSDRGLSTNITWGEDW